MRIVTEPYKPLNNPAEKPYTIEYGKSKTTDEKIVVIRTFNKVGAFCPTVALIRNFSQGGNPYVYLH